MNARAQVCIAALCTFSRIAAAAEPAKVEGAGPEPVPPTLGTDAPNTPQPPPSDPTAKTLTLPPLFMEKHGQKGGYLHVPLLLTTSSWSKESAFTSSALLYLRTRKGTNTDSALFPFYFHGEDTAVGASSSYTLIPPLLFYTKKNEEQGSSVTWVGPYMQREDPKRRTTALFPFYYHIGGKPQDKGEEESHTTIFPLMHYGKTKDRSLLVTPGVLTYRSVNASTLMTPFYSNFDNRKANTSLTVAGPVVPMFIHYKDRPLGLTGTGVLPFFYADSSPRHNEVWTPAYYHRNNYGQNTFTWALPTFTLSTDSEGWAAALHPVVYVGHSGAAKHLVVAPVYWRFSNSDTGSLTQVALNTLYTQKRVNGGTDWQFHLLPLFSYGENPRGHFWNVLFGLAGYTREDERRTVRALWIPFNAGGDSASAK